MIKLRRATPEDAAALAAVEVRSWRAAYRGLMPDTLMQAGMQELRDLGMREATLWVLRDNLRARRFYEQLGWTPDGRTVIEDYGGALLEALCYRHSMDA